jgi:hypothetical protein
MIKLYKILMTIAVIFISGLSLSAQEVRIVKVDGWDPASGENVEDYNNVFFNAVEADSTERKTNPNVIFELTRGHQYPQGKDIKNYDYHLHIRAAEGEGLQPEFIPGKREDGSYGSDYIRAQTDVTLEHITFNGFRPDGAYLNRMVEVYGNGTRYTVKGCLFDGDRGAGIVLRGDSMRVYVEDVVVGNTGYNQGIGGNGRILDMRPEALFLDTLIMRNSTVNNASDRIIRNMGTEVGYLEIDHFTALNTVGFHGGVQLGYVHTAKVTNSLFANVISLGHVDSRTAEQTQPVKHFAVITLDTVFDDQVIEIRNNNIYWDQEIKDVWAKYDSVEAPYAISPSIETALGDAEAIEQAWFPEPVVMTLTCGPISEYVDAYFADPSAASFPRNWCIGGQGGYFLDEADLSYASEYDSYTAADMGYPVGNLNYFPDLKAMWEEGIDLTSSVEPVDRVVNQSLKNYPNPFSNTTTIAYELGNSSFVNLELFDLTGRKIKTLVNEFKPAGQHEVSFNASDLSSGMYLYKLDNGNETKVNNMIIAR